MKKLVLLLTVATILLLGTFTVLAQENQLNVEVNGETIEFTNDSGKPFVDSNYRTQIPVRIVLEKLGINVTWDSLFQVVHTSKEDIECNIPVGHNQLIINNETVEIDTAAVIKNNRTYIPIRQVLEAYGYNVSWDGYKKSVYIYDDDYEAYYDEILEKSNILLEEQQVLQEEQALQKKIEEANKLNVMNGYGIVKENTNYNFIEQALTSVNKVHIYKQDKQTGVLQRINTIDYSEGFYVNDDYLINLGHYCIERIDLATNKKIKLVDVVDVRMLARSGFLIGDWFYYSDLGIYTNGKKNPPSFNRVNILTGKIDYIQDDRFTDMIYFDGYFIGKNEKESGNPYNYFNLNTLQFEDKLEVRQYMAPALYTEDGIIGTGFSLNPLLLDLDEKVVEELPVDVEIEGTYAIDYQYNYCFKGDYLYGITDGLDDNYYFVKINYVTMDYQVKPFIIDEYRALYLTAIDNRLYFSASNVIPGTSMMGDYSIYSMDLNGEDIQLVIK